MRAGASPCARTASTAIAGFSNPEGKIKIHLMGNEQNRHFFLILCLMNHIDSVFLFQNKCFLIDFPVS